MAPVDSVRKKIPIFQQVYGVKGPDGSVNGQLYTRSIISDTMKGIIIFLLTALFVGGCDAYKWYIKNKEMPTAFSIHCIEQTKTDKELAGTLGRIEEGIKDLKDRRRR